MVVIVSCRVVIKSGSECQNLISRPRSCFFSYKTHPVVIPSLLGNFDWDVDNLELKYFKNKTSLSIYDQITRTKSSTVFINWWQPAKALR